MYWSKSSPAGGTGQNITLSTLKGSAGKNEIHPLVPFRTGVMFYAFENDSILIFIYYTF